MNTFILNTKTAGTSIQDLLSQIADGNITVLDGEGNTLAYVLSPRSREELIYAEAQRDLDLHRGEIQQALERRDGITTTDLLARAKAAAQKD
jgi:hypothetical protein